MCIHFFLICSDPKDQYFFALMLRFCLISSIDVAESIHPFFMNSEEGHLTLVENVNSFTVMNSTVLPVQSGLTLLW